MKRKAGICAICGKPVYVLTGKDIPPAYRGWTAAYCDFVGRDTPDARKRHHKCYDTADLAEHQKA